MADLETIVETLTDTPGTARNPIGDIEHMERHIIDNRGADYLTALYERGPATWNHDDDLQLRSSLWVLEWLGDYNIDHEWRNEIRGLWSLVRPGGFENYSHIPRDKLNRLANERSTWKFLRTENGITTGQAAADLDVHQATISRWENGTRTPENANDTDRYKAWLHQRRREILAYHRWNVLRSAVLRDAWPNFPRGTEQHTAWQEFWRRGGYHDQYRCQVSVPGRHSGSGR